MALTHTAKSARFAMLWQRSQVLTLLRSRDADQLTKVNNMGGVPGFQVSFSYRCCSCSSSTAVPVLRGHWAPLPVPLLHEPHWLNLTVLSFAIACLFEWCVVEFD